MEVELAMSHSSSVMVTCLHECCDLAGVSYVLHQLSLNYTVARVVGVERSENMGGYVTETVAAHDDVPPLDLVCGRSR